MYVDNVYLPGCFIQYITALQGSNPNSTNSFYHCCVPVWNRNI